MTLSRPSAGAIGHTFTVFISLHKTNPRAQAADMMTIEACLWTRMHVDHLACKETGRPPLSFYTFLKRKYHFLRVR
jgi:hypothetical protein